MEHPSTPVHKGWITQQGFLLAVSLSTFWIPPITAQSTVESSPHHVAEGQDVVLILHNLPENLYGYGWYKGETIESIQQIASYVIDTQENTPGPAHSSRETIYHNGSLLIQNVIQEDTGPYTLQAIHDDFQTQEVTGQIHVFPVLPKAHITSKNPNPMEDKDSVELTCEPETQDTSYLWSIKSQSLPDSPRLQLSKENRSLTILHVTRKDTGPYVCDAQNPMSASRSDPFILNVLYGPDIPSISPSGSFYRPGANLSLSCHSDSNPPSQYSWLINGTAQQYTQELVIPNITESDSGTYTCLAHNSATGLYRIKIRIIMVSESVAPPSIIASNTIVTEDRDRVVLTCLTNDIKISFKWFINNQSLQLTDRMTLSRDHHTLTINPVRREDAGDYQCEVSNTLSSSKSDPITLTVTAGGVTTDLSAGLSAGAIAGIVIGVLAGVVLTVVLGCVLIRRRSGRTGDKPDLKEHQTPVSTPGWAPSGRSAPLTPHRDTKPAVPIYEELQHPHTGTYCRINPMAQAAS